MEKMLIKSDSINLDGIVYEIKFFQVQSSPGSIRYSSEVIFDHYDKIIVDDENLNTLEDKIFILAPLAYYTRIIAKMESIL